MPFLTQGKTNWKFIAIVAVLAVIIGVGIWSYSQMMEEESETPPADIPEKVIEDETADWQVYSGTYFSFEYPSSWEEETDPAGSYKDSLEVIGLRISPTAVFEVSYRLRSYEAMIDGYTGRKSRHLTVDGREAMEFELAGSGESLPADYSIISFIVKGSDNNVYQITFNGSRDDITDKLLYQILSTFRFTDEKPVRCVTDEDCIVFGNENNTNCGCFHKDSQWEPIEVKAGTDPLPVPTHCRCIDGACGSVVGSFLPDFDLVYIKKIYTEKEKEYLDVDYIEWVGCGGFNSECVAPNGYVIMNYDPEIVTFEISENVDIRMCSPSHYVIWDEKIDYERFKELLKEHSYYTGGIPFHIKIQDNKITEIKEQYIP